MVEEELHLDDWVPASEEDRHAVLTQLDRLLDSPLFRNSKRYPNMLRYVVEQALEGHEAALKERLVGIAVFHRPPDYDTNQDTVVRLTAGEVRKRIAQYYHQPEHVGELQIDLRPGSYVPVFRRPELRPEVQVPAGPAVRAVGVGAAGAAAETGPAAASGAEGGQRTVAPVVEPPKTERRFAMKRLRLVAACAVLVAATAAGMVWRYAYGSAPAADRQLWAPILETPGPVQLVVADLSAAIGTVQVQPATGGLFDLLRMGEIVNYRDSLALTDIVAFLSTHNKPYQLELSSHASYQDLQRNASVFVGGIDNVWTMRVTDPLRYHFVRRGMSYTYAIEDRQHPEQGGWSVDLTQPTDRNTEDYAIVARAFDVTTGRPVLVVAGIGANGTAAATQFLLQPERIAELAPHAPRNWQHMNMEAVIRTQILDNHAGPPHLVACSFW